MIKIFLSLFFSSFIFSQALAGFEAKKGHLDLTGWNIEKQLKISLNGEWKFYWKKFIDPLEVQKNGPPLNYRTIKVPGLWNSLKENKNSKKYLSTGFGTYILKVTGLKTKNNIGFFLGNFSNAFKAYIIQENKITPLIQAGKVGKDSKASIPQGTQKQNFINISGQDFYIVFHASSFHYRAGGFFGPLILGKSEVLKDDLDKNNFTAFFVLGVILIMSLYHFGLFGLRKKDKGSMWFGLFCLDIFFRELTTKAFILKFSAPSTFIFYLNARLEYLSLYLGAPIFMMFLKFLFDKYYNQKIINIFWFISISYSTLCLVTPPTIFTQSHYLWSYQVVMLVGIVYGIFNIIRAALHKTQYSRILLLAVFFLVTGVIYDMLVVAQKVPPPFISPYTFIAFIFIQSYILATKFSYAYATAEKLSIDLEKEVKIQTREAVEAKDRAEESEGNVSNLLNNMRQSVFTINSKGIIMVPVSRFTYDIFGKNIEGENVFSNIFTLVDKSSELYTGIGNVFITSFDEDEFQWDLSEDYLPRRITFKAKEDDPEKILKIAYTPLWDQDEKLERIMFVVEDITEIEKLEKEMNEQKSAASKNIQMLHEMASSNKEDLGLFFSNALKLAGNALKATKTYRENLADKETFPELESLFRDLHTLKGNSRIFGLSLISSLVHILESTVSEFKTAEKEKNKPEINGVDDFIQQLYGVQGQINDYMKVGKEVFDLEFSEDKKFKKELHHSISFFEFIFQESILVPLANIEEKDFSKKLNSLKESDIFKDNFYQLKMNLHTTKGIARSIGEKDISEQVHQLESGFEYITTNETITNNNFLELIIAPVEKVFKLGKDLYFSSSMQKEKQNISHENWVKIFIHSFKLADSHLKGTVDDHDFKLNLETLKITSSEFQLDYVGRIVKKCFNSMEHLYPQKTILKYCQELWTYLSIISSLDFEKNCNPEKTEPLLQELNKEDKAIDISSDFGKTIFTSFLRALQRDDIPLNSFYEVIEKLLRLKKPKAIQSFIPHAPSFSLMGSILTDLEDNYSSSIIDQVIKGTPSENLELFFNLKEFIQSSSDIYLKKIETLTLLRHFTDFDNDSKDLIMPQVVEVLLDNFTQFKKTIDEVNDNTDQSHLQKITHSFDKLLDLPVKYSFARFTAVVKELSQDLGKKVKFVLSGDQGSLNRDKLNLLLDSMIHLVRNSLDHGIENPDVRLSNGKEEFGTLEIECKCEESNQLQIMVRDDGKGINPEIVVKKGLDKGFITEDQANSMTDDEKVSLIFLPNFSTKEVTTEVSGRGVGMDVVKKNFEAIGADLSMKNTPGQGTEFKIIINQ